MLHGCLMPQMLAKNGDVLQRYVRSYFLHDASAIHTLDFIQHDMRGFPLAAHTLKPEILVDVCFKLLSV